MKYTDFKKQAGFWDTANSIVKGVGSAVAPYPTFLGQQIGHAIGLRKQRHDLEEQYPDILGPQSNGQPVSHSSTSTVNNKTQPTPGNQIRNNLVANSSDNPNSNAQSNAINNNTGTNSQPNTGIIDTYKNLPKAVQLGVQDALDAFKPGANVTELGKFDKDLFNSEDFRNLKSNEEKLEYLQRIATKTGIFAALYQKDENGKVKSTGVIGDLLKDPDKLSQLPDQVLSNPEFFDSLVTAVENSKDIDTLNFLQWARDKVAAGDKSDTASEGGAVNPTNNSGLSVALTEEQESRLTKAAAKSLWNQVQEDPLTNIPKAAGLFLRQAGLDGLASFAENPFVFYLSLAGLLLGGGALLAGGGNEQQPIIINTGNGGSYDPRMAQIPYSYR